MTKPGGGVPPPIALCSPGPREVVTESRAQEFVETWKAELDAHRTAVRAAVASSTGVDPSDVPDSDLPHPCDRVVLSDKSYMAEAAVVIASFFTRGEVGRTVASGVTDLNLADVIASRMEDEGLQVLQTLCDAFRDSRLVEVDLSDNAMGSKGVSACRSVLTGQTSSLERLSLCNNGLAAESMGEVADILTGSGDDQEGTEDDAAATDGSVICERLSKIHFFNNMSGDGGCTAFARILHRCSDRLTDVRFSGTRAPRAGSVRVASAMDEMGDKVKNIVRLDLADNSFGPEGSAKLFGTLSRCSSLTYLNLRDCVLEDGGVKQVCHALWSSDVPLVHLDLSGNEITKKGAKALAEYIEENVTLKVLHAEENEMTSLGIKLIAKALAAEGGGGKGNTVSGVYLGCNECGTIGATALVDAYREGEGMPHLTKIDLDGNGFTEEDVEALEGAFGDKLGEMEDNDEEAEWDEELSDEESEDEEEVKDEVDVAALTEAMAKTSLC
uniref:WPP domain-containing protein n=1 Tax=Trieres chinensis TaxID=1514140 RepID=A0A7S2AA50_TRICV